MLTILAETLLLLLSCISLIGMAYAIGRAAALGWYKSRFEHLKLMVKFIDMVKLLKQQQEEPNNDN